MLEGAARAAGTDRGGQGAVPCCTRSAGASSASRDSWMSMSSVGLA